MIARRLSVLWISVVLAGCSDKSESSATQSSTGESAVSDGPLACVPGAQVPCACLGGVQGVQVCLPDGSGYDACEGCDTGGGDPSSATSTGETTTTTTTSSSTTTSTTGAPITCPGSPGNTVDLHQAILHDNPPGLVDWPVTTSLTEIDFTDDGVHVLFSRLDGPERWPDIVPPGWDGPLQYTLGMAECIDGQWHASAAIQFWYGLAASGGNIAVDDQVAQNWYYDPGRWGELAGRQPATGELIGIFVVAGNARGVLEDTPLQSPVMERSDLVLVPMPDPGGATHSF